MKHEIKGLLFDKDGTLFDFHKSWGGWTRSFITTLAADPDEEVQLSRALGFDLATGAFEPESAVIAGTPDETMDAILAAKPGLSRDALLEMVLSTTADAPQAEAVPLGPLLDRFRSAGIRLGVATNDGEAPARTHLTKAGVLDRFEFIAGYDSGHGAKPEPGMPLAFLAATGLAPETCAMVGDSLHDLIAGRAADMLTVAVLTGVANAPALSPHADVVLPSIAELPGWIGLD